MAISKPSKTDGKCFVPVYCPVSRNKPIIINYDDEIRKLYTKQDCIKKAIKYLENDEETKLNNLIDKWKRIGQMASNYLFSLHKSNIDKVGGIKQYNKIKNFQKKSSIDQYIIDNYENFIQSVEYHELSIHEKQDLQNRFHKMVSDSSDSDSDWSQDLTMEDLYDQLQLDYSLVYDE